jgi:tetratricopeptide (TPR) repeat protein
MLFLSDNFMGRAEADISDLKFSLAETNLRSAATFDPLNYNLHYNLAWAYYYLIPENIEKYRQSYVSELERTINLSPEDYRGYEDLGKYYLLSKDYPKSEEYLKKAVALNPVGKPELYLRLASAYYLQDKKAEARDLLDQAAGNYQTSLKSSVIWVVQNKEKILSDISQIHTDLGILYQQAGDKSRAKSEYLLALDYYAENKTAQKYLEEPGIE